MDSRAELVRSLVRWALTILAAVESAQETIPGPRLCAIQLGRLMCRKDTATAISIAHDIGFRADKDLTILLNEIRNGWGEDSVPRVKRDKSSDAYDVSVKLIREVRSLLTEDQERLLLYGSRMKTWKALEIAFPERTWVELRTTFESLAIIVYQRHSYTLCETSDFIADHLPKR